jgi:hypothetical protein
MATRAAFYNSCEQLQQPRASVIFELLSVAHIVVIHRITAEPLAELAGPPHGPVVDGFALRCISKPIGVPD